MCVGTGESIEKLLYIESEHVELVGYVNTHEWCQVLAVVASTQPNDGIPGQAWWLPMDYMQGLRILNCSAQYFVISTDYLRSFVTFDTRTDKLLLPDMRQTTDGRWCTPHYVGPGVPHLYGPGQYDDLIMFGPFLFDTNLGFPKYEFPAMFVTETQYVYRKESSPIFVADITPANYRCDAYSETTNTLPLSISAIPHTIGHVLYALIGVIAALLRDTIGYLLSLVPVVVWRYSFWLVACYCYAQYKTGNLATALMLTALVLSVLVYVDLR